jgi:hypothetical protein
MGFVVIIRNNLRCEMEERSFASSISGCFRPEEERIKVRRDLNFFHIMQVLPEEDELLRKKGTGLF